MATPTQLPPDADPVGNDQLWVELRIKVPRAWKAWLQEAADARALTVSAVVRQCIRELMIRRHDGGH